MPQSFLDSNAVSLLNSCYPNGDFQNLSAGKQSDWKADRHLRRPGLYGGNPSDGDEEEEGEQRRRGEDRNRQNFAGIRAEVARMID